MGQKYRISLLSTSTPNDRMQSVIRENSPKYGVVMTFEKQLEIANFRNVVNSIPKLDPFNNKHQGQHEASGV